MSETLKGNEIISELKNRQMKFFLRLWARKSLKVSV